MNTKEIEQLRLKFKTIESGCWLYVTGTDYGYQVQKLFKEGKLDLFEVKPRDKWLSDTYRDFGHRDALFTFKDCVTVELNAHEAIEVTVWDGDNLYGSRIAVRCTFVLGGPWWLLDFFVNRINDEFAKHCLQLAQAEERAILTNRALTIQFLILKNKYNKEKEIVNRVYPGILGKIKWKWHLLWSSYSLSASESDTNTDE